MKQFTVFGKPEGKARPRVTRNHAYTPERTRAYEEMVRVAYLQGCGSETIIPAGIPVTVDILAFYAVPKSAPKKLQAQMRNNKVRPLVKPDWDNVGKIVCDALNGLAWHDDAQVVEAHVEKRYGLTPMVCVRIEEMSSEPNGGNHQ